MAGGAAASTLLGAACMDDDVDGGGFCGSAAGHLDSLLARWAPINYPRPWGGQDVFWGAERPPGTPAAAMPGPMARKAWNLSLLAFEQANTCGAFAALIHTTLSLVGACRTLRDFRAATDCPLPPECVARENAIVDSFLQYSAVWLTGWALMATTEEAAGGGGDDDDDGGQRRRQYALGQTLATADAAAVPAAAASAGGSSVAELRGTCVAAAAMLDMLRGVYDPAVQAAVYDDEPTWRTAEQALRAGYPRTQYAQIGANIVLMLRGVFAQERSRYYSSKPAAPNDDDDNDSLRLLADVCFDESARRTAERQRQKRSLAGRRARQRRRPGWWSSAAGTSGNDDDDDDDAAAAAAADTDQTYTPTRKHRRRPGAADGRQSGGTKKPKAR